MKPLFIALALLTLPVAAAAQQVPVPLPPGHPLPGRDTLPSPPVLVLSSSSRSEAVLAGAMEGATLGAVYGAVLAEQRPDCAPSTSSGASAVQGALFGGVWGGLRALFTGRRHSRIRTVTDGDRLPKTTPQPSPDRGAAVPPLADRSCLASPPGTVERVH
ncbi:MAG TPA: hypothetical protein VFS20_05950 [Longimicrobium sp.]|nr:hypothetical protein [Longimicrobium sp.]